MTRLLITTVGTSLLTNRDRPWNWAHYRNDPLPPEAKVDEWLATADPVQASAETNTLHRREIQETDRISFLHSDTNEGLYCSQRLETYYARQCQQVRQCVLAALSYQETSFAQRGLKSLISVTLQEINFARDKDLTPIFCATGGFKAEIAFLNLLGALLNIEVYYIHELHREEVQLPRLPLIWDTNYVIEHQNFFDWIQNDIRESIEVESWLNASPGLRALVETDEIDGVFYTVLNAAGTLLFEAAKAYRPRVQWPDASDNSPEEKNGLSGIQHSRPTGWQDFVTRLSNIDCVAYFHSDNSVGQTKVIDPAEGTIGVRFGQPGDFLRLRVKTTARGSEQTQLVAAYIQRMI